MTFSSSTEINFYSTHFPKLKKKIKKNSGIKDRLHIFE